MTLELYQMHTGHYMVRKVGSKLCLTKRGTFSADYGAIWATKYWAEIAMNKHMARMRAEHEVIG